MTYFSPADSVAHKKANAGYNVADLCRNCGFDFMDHTNASCPDQAERARRASVLAVRSFEQDMRELRA